MSTFVGKISRADRRDRPQHHLVTLTIKRDGLPELNVELDSRKVDGFWPDRMRDLVSSDARHRPFLFTVDERGNVTAFEPV